jgi:hypothetical protein
MNTRKLAGKFMKLQLIILIETSRIPAFAASLLLVWSTLLDHTEAKATMGAG